MLGCTIGASDHLCGGHPTASIYRSFSLRQVIFPSEESTNLLPALKEPSEGKRVLCFTGAVSVVIYPYSVGLVWVSTELGCPTYTENKPSDFS